MMQALAALAMTGAAKAGRALASAENMGAPGFPPRKFRVDPRSWLAMPLPAPIAISVKARPG